MGGGWRWRIDSFGCYWLDVLVGYALVAIDFVVFFRALIGWRAFVEGGGRESPGMRVTFFCFAKRKSPKKRRPPVCDPFAVRRGKPAAVRLRGAPWNSLCAGARRSDSHGESVHEAWALRRPCSPHNRPAAGAASRGGPNIQQPNSHTGHRCARPRLRSARRLRRRDGAERSNGPCGCPLPGFPSVCAWGAQGAGWHARRSARAS
ncbi:hypothetical protein C8C99_2078 [Acidovorax sp. 107]|nr:hypothetical protein C8C99_2078 [Acidovorax sp. 107]